MEGEALELQTMEEMWFPNIGLQKATYSLVWFSTLYFFCSIVFIFHLSLNLSVTNLQNDSCNPNF